MSRGESRGIEAQRGSNRLKPGSNQESERRRAGLAQRLVPVKLHDSDKTRGRGRPRRFLEPAPWLQPIPSSRRFVGLWLVGQRYLEEKLPTAVIGTE